MSERSDAEAIRFIDGETQFHLGFLPTEQSSPLTRNLDRDFAESAEKGVRSLQSVDRNVLAMLRRVLPGPEFRELTDTLIRTIGNGGRVVFSGCGATGRLSILLEAMWRDAAERGIAFHDMPQDRLIPDRHHRFRQHFGHIAQTRPLAAAEDHDRNIRQFRLG